MATLPFYENEPAPVSVEEYLHTVYEPECDYVDGRLEDRNVGEYDHSLLQALLAHFFMTNRKEWGVVALTELRTQVKHTRFRCPDVLVLRADAPREQILTHPPLIAIEILSPEDRLSRFRIKIEDYVAFGVENIWIIDPATRSAMTADRFGLHPVETGELAVPNTPIRMALAALFAELDRA
ncbi:MAG TPA: Uma2 family endonuclease [Terracidiphilus sp.]|jgi:Uma2 family endonuclease|nr:Uma2 family endonuclease [Terracidiphilus sp.]